MPQYFEGFLFETCTWETSDQVNISDHFNIPKDRAESLNKIVDELVNQIKDRTRKTLASMSENKGIQFKDVFFCPIEMMGLVFRQPIIKTVEEACYVSFVFGRVVGAMEVEVKSKYKETLELLETLEHMEKNI